MALLHNLFSHTGTYGETACKAKKQKSFACLLKHVYWFWLNKLQAIRFVGLKYQSRIAPPCVHKWTYICEAVVVAPQGCLFLTSIFANKTNASQHNHNVYSKQSEEVHLLI